jgi:neutral ceramidase
MNEKLQAGLYKFNITPSVNGPIVGGFTVPTAQDIIDEFYANALVIDDGSTEVAVVSVDIIGIPYKVYKDIADKIESTCDIPAENVIISATHNHTSVRLKEDGNDVYTEYLIEAVVSAVYLAKKRKQPVRIGVGRSENRNYVFNRRLKKPDGSIVMNWIDRDYLQDCIDDGAVDPELIVVKIENEDKQPIGFIVNYANHNNSVGNLRRSADISGYIGELLRRIYGEDVVTVFLLGACGNTNWVNYRDYTQKNDPKLYQRIATGITGTALEIIAEMDYPEIDRIEINSRLLKIAERAYNDYDDKIDNTFGEIKDGDIPAGFKFFKEAKEKNKDKPLGLYDVDIHVLKLGKDIVIASNPCELFTEFGLDIKSQSPFKYTMVTELTNGTIGYVPTLKAYEEGGYEVRKPANRVEKNAGEKIVKNTVELLKELY